MDKKFSIALLVLVLGGIAITLWVFRAEIPTPSLERTPLPETETETDPEDDLEDDIEEDFEEDIEDDLEEDDVE